MKTIIDIIGPAFALFMFACFAFSPQAAATCQEGCLTNANTVLGDDALTSNTGTGQTAAGSHALFSNTTGSFNTASGTAALFSNTTGFSNTATGFEALYSNTTGSSNTATGLNALQTNASGGSNTATGFGALRFNTTGKNNTATGAFALLHNTTGNSNIALGDQAGGNLTTGDSNIDVGNRGVAGEANDIRLGTKGTQTATVSAGVSGATVTGTAVVVNSSGQLGVAPSSRRFKQNIQTMGDASDILLALRPVTFEYTPDVDPKGVSQFGLVAEEVEKVNPDLVARDDEGKPYTVRYDAVNAMLLNEFLKEHRKVEQLTKDFESKLAEQQKQIETLTAGLQKVSAQVEMSHPASQIALNNQ